MCLPPLAQQSFWPSPHQGPTQECCSLVLTKTYSQEPQPHSNRDKPQYNHWECCRELSYWSQQNTAQLFQQWKSLPLYQSCPSTLRWCGRWSSGRRWSTYGRSPRSACTSIPEWILCKSVINKSIKYVVQTSANDIFIGDQLVVVRPEVFVPWLSRLYIIVDIVSECNC